MTRLIASLFSARRPAARPAALGLTRLEGRDCPAMIVGNWQMIQPQPLPPKVLWVAIQPQPLPPKVVVGSPL